MSIEEVIFLGAGASASDGAPIQNELFKSYFSNHNNDELSNSLKEFFRDFFGINPDKNGNETFPTFEEVLGILELSISRNESFRKYPIVPGNPKVQEVREQLIFLIAKILRQKLLYGRVNHDKLINRLINERMIKKTAFISLNYDILIDNAITEKHDEVDLDYGISFTNFLKRDDWHKPRKNRKTLLLKLHGSLNWLYCPTCISLTITPKEKSVSTSTIAERPIACERCNTNMIPIIIPPTFFKVMSNYFLQKIWRRAEMTLSRTKRIIFCGYSFPDADIHIKYLLKRVEVNKGNTPEIFIVNNHAGKKNDIKQEEELRYKRFFADSSRVHYLNLSFEEFCEKRI